jgi:hypothetical protein
VSVEATGSRIAPLRTTLERLLAMKREEAWPLGYETTLQASSVRVGDIARKDGVFIIDLVGQFLSAGTCEDPRIKKQIELTAGQFGPYRILLNGSESAWRCLFDESGECE